MPVDTRQLLRDADLDGALSAVKAEIRAAPGDVRHRIFLFQLLAVIGDWEKALTQLNVAGGLDAGTLAMVQTYREALRCEALRDAVFAGRHAPLVFGEPERWIALMFESLRQLADGQFTESARLRAAALEDAPAIPGTVNGEPFEWLADADSRIGPFLEVIVDGKYYWVPFHRIARLNIEPPEDLRDLVWLPADITWANGGQSVGLIPSRYPGSAVAADNRIRLARRTDWEAVGEEAWLGLGQKLLTTDAQEYPLLEVREVVFNG